MSVYYNGKEVSEVVYGTGDTGKLNFKAIGYEDTDIPQYMKDGLEYAKEIKDNWKPDINPKGWKNDKNLVFFPKVDTSNISLISQGFGGCSNLIFFPSLDLHSLVRMDDFFNGCTSLLYVPYLNAESCTTLANCFYGCSSLRCVEGIDVRNVTSLNGCFYGCKNLNSIPNLNTSKVTKMEYTFRESGITEVPEIDLSSCTSLSACFTDCINLTSLRPLNTEKVTKFSGMVEGCTNLLRVEGLSFYSHGYSNYQGDFILTNNNTTCRYILIKDIGTNPDCTSLVFTRARVWGIDNDKVPDAKQSLIDSLLTYSFDRRAAGYSDCTIKLYSSVKAVLTEEELAAIQAKGYIITT